MFLSDASVRRPVAMTCLIIALSLLGLRAYRDMSLEWLPQIDIPYITVLTVYPGGTPAEIETDIGKRIEDVIVSVEGIKHVTTSCMENACQILLEFQLGVDVDVAANDVREKIDMVVNDFPSGVEKPTVLKFDINAIPIISLALTGDAPIDALYDYADNELKDRLTTTEGVATTEIVGGSPREVQVRLDRDALAARGLSSTDVVRAVQEGVGKVPAGRIHDDAMEYAVTFDAEYAAPEALEALEIANADGARCHIGDVGRVVMAPGEERQAAFIDGRPAISVKIVKRPGANAVRVVDRVQAAVSEMQRQLPGGMELVWVSDDAQFIRASVRDTQTNIWQGILLTALILFFFLYNFRSTIIVAVTMPITILIGLFFMGLIDYTLNACTLLAIGLSVGILITNSIVVLESIVKRLEECGDPREAARIGSKQVAVAVAASAGTNLVVLFPVATMGSMVGLFFAPFAWTMAIMTAVSLFVSFTLTPLLCGVFLKAEKPGRRSLLAALSRVWDRGLALCVRVLNGILHFFDKRRWAAALLLLAVAGLFLQSMKIAERLGMDFFPDVDRGELIVKLEFPTRYSFEHTLKRVHEAEQRLANLPELQHRLTTIGKVDASVGLSSEGVYLAQILLRFSNKDERRMHVTELQEQARLALEDYPDCMPTVREVGGLGGQSTPVQMLIAGNEFAKLDELALRIEGFAEEIPEVLDPETTVRPGKPEIEVLPRRAVLSDLGLPALALGMTLRANIEGLEAGTFKSSGRNYDIVVKYEEDRGKEQVTAFQFPAAPGRPVGISALAHIEEGQAPIQINRRDKQRVSKVFAGVDGALGTAVEKLSTRINEEGQFPPGYRYAFFGDVEIMGEAQQAMGEAALIAMILVFLVLAAILESFRQPFIIMLTIPLGLIGVLWGLGLAGLSISMFVLLGGVMLIGIVVNNAILIMDQLNQNVAEGVPRHEAMMHAASTRFRPIVMITLAAILGMLPLALAQGIGSEMRTAIGVASVGGIAVSAVLTLLVLPIVYDLFTRGQKKKKGKPEAH